MNEWAGRQVRCVAKTARTSVIIGVVGAVHEISSEEVILLVDIEGTLTCVEIDVEFWALETLDNADKAKLTRP